MDRAGPRAVMELGVLLMAGGLLLAPLTSEPWHLYRRSASWSCWLGVSRLFRPVVVPAEMGFIRKRGFAIGIAFALASASVR